SPPARIGEERCCLFAPIIWCLKFSPFLFHCCRTLISECRRVARTLLHLQGRSRWRPTLGTNEDSLRPAMWRHVAIKTQWKKTRSDLPVFPM
ncbi:hypothetical protein MHYP_G00186350, partial [Metynnis hypsauchen]